MPAGTSDRWLFRWTLNGDQLAIGQTTSVSYRDPLEQVTEWILKVTGWSFLTVELRAQVIEVRADRIRLREIGTAGRAITLERISR